MVHAKAGNKLWGGIDWKIRFSILATGFLVGGLTFYAAIVVPAASAVWGATDQGFVTRLVTWRYNALATPLWCWLIFVNWRSADRLMRVLMVTMLSIQAALWISHRSLDVLLDPSQNAVLDESVFYVRHQVYLWLTTIQIIVGWGMLWKFSGTIYPQSVDLQASVDQRCQSHRIEVYNENRGGK